MQEKKFVVPGSIMLRHDTRKYLPQAVPRSTLSENTPENILFSRTIAHRFIQLVAPKLLIWINKDGLENFLHY